MTIDTGLKPHLSEIEDVRRNWGWFFALGVLLIALGIGIISSAVYATLFSIIIFGFFLIGAGIVQGFQAFLARKWSGLFLSLLLSILYIVTGVLCVAQPLQTAINLTLLIALLCFIGGLFKMITSLILHFDQWGWVFFNGLVTFILGFLIYSGWPVSGLWVIGMFIGIDIILSGWSWIILSLTARRRFS